MNILTRRALLRGAAAVPLLGAAAARSASSAAATELRSLTGAAQPISRLERRARLAKLQALMGDRGIGALLIEPGATLEYFTGVRWHLSERTTAALIPARGEVLIVTPAFEEPSVRETLAIEGEIRAWNEQESPFERIVQGARERRLGSAKLAVDPAVRFFVWDGVRRSGGAYRFVPGDALIRACRIIKSEAELALMQLANEVTLAAMRYARARLEPGMTSEQLGALVDAATQALGGEPEFSLVLLNEASAYPHGSAQPQTVREGSIVLMDCGCTVHGYQSDVSRTWVHGEASARQRKIWNTVKRGQEIVLERATLGAPVGRIDDAVRQFYESEGFGPGYKLPGLPHRAGHGIGLDGHEPAYLVHGDATLLEAGMCFSDEPGLYIPGEFGVRLEDCWHMSAAGPRLFTHLAKDIEEP